MRRRWLHLGYVHTQLPLSKEERRAVEKRANVIAGRGKYFTFKLAFVSALMLGIGIGGSMIAGIWAWIQFSLHPLVFLIGWPFACLIIAFVYSRIVRRWFTRPTRIALNEMGYNICVRCGYWLRDLGADVQRFPECGAEREQVTPIERV